MQNAIQTVGANGIQIFKFQFLSKDTRACCKMMQHALKLWNCLLPMDVGALIERPRAIINRPYQFCRYISEFCNRPLFTLLSRIDF